MAATDDSHQLTPLEEIFNDLLEWSPEWVPITTFTSGYGNNSFGYDCAFRVWPNGKVDWRGGVRKTSGNIPHGTVLFTAPSDAWPSETCEFDGCISVQTAQTSTARVEFATNGDVGVYLGSSSAAATAWVTLDGITYDKE